MEKLAISAYVKASESHGAQRVPEVAANKSVQSITSSAHHTFALATVHHGKNSYMIQMHLNNASGNNELTEMTCTTTLNPSSFFSLPLLV
jgi:hypothetical protein